MFSGPSINDYYSLLMFILLILVSNPPFPPRSLWMSWMLATHLPDLECSPQGDIQMLTFPLLLKSKFAFSINCGFELSFSYKNI